MPDAKTYQVIEEDQKYRVEDDSGRAILSCGDRGSAEHYATLLNQAYERGYRNGYREGKAGGDGPSG